MYIRRSDRRRLELINLFIVFRSKEVTVDVRAAIVSRNSTSFVVLGNLIYVFKW